MLLCVPGVLTREELATIRRALADGEFVDGRITAGFRARRVKDNLQLKKTVDQAKLLDGIVVEALRRHKLVQAAALPRRIHTALFCRYRPGMRYGAHVDDALMNRTKPLRTDVAVTVFIAEPADYEGGELVVETSFGEQPVKLAAGDAVLYPASSVHRVAPVTAGERVVAVTWMQSVVRRPAERELLSDLNTVRHFLAERLPEAAETDLAFKSYSNLLRMWAEP